MFYLDNVLDSSPVAIIVSMADKRSSIKVFNLPVETLKESFSASRSSETLINPSLYCLEAKFKLFLQLFLVVQKFRFFLIKRHSLQDCFREVIVVFVWCHQFNFESGQCLFSLRVLSVLFQNLRKFPISPQPLPIRGDSMKIH